MKQRLILSFIAGQLVETSFSHPLNATARRSIRGKSPGAFSNCGSFQWTAAVQALSILCLRAAAGELRQLSGSVPLSGQKGSLAASLDYAISKSPNWIVEMFGNDSRGTSLVKRLIRITNPNQKRPGPVSLSLNEGFFSPSGIEIQIAGISELSPERIEHLIERIESDFAGKSLPGKLIAEVCNPAFHQLGQD